MAPLCYRRHPFPPEIIQHAIWLYLRFTLSYGDVEELLAERGLYLSYETIRRNDPALGAQIRSRDRARPAAAAAPAAEVERRGIGPLELRDILLEGLMDMGS